MKTCSKGYKLRMLGAGREREATLKGEAWLENTIIYDVSEAQLPELSAKMLSWFPKMEHRKKSN